MNNQTRTGVTSVEVKSDGKKLPDSFAIVRVEVEKRVNRISAATIEILDGSAAQQDFPLSADKMLSPGSEIEVSAGFGSNTDPIFKGVITKVGIRADGEFESRLIIECKDHAIKMTVGRKSANYINKKDSEIIRSLISSYSGLTPSVDTTETEQHELVQYYCSDWDFLIMRAEANGLLVTTDGGDVQVKKAELSKSVVSVSYGVNVISIELDVNSSSQLASVKTRAWSSKQQEITEQSVAPAAVNKIGDLNAKKLSTVAGLDEYELQSPVSLETSELKTWGQAQQVKADFSRVSGSIRIRGTADARPGATIDLDGVGQRFSGKSYITGVVHVVEDGAWETDIEVGMDDTWFSEKSPVAYPAATAAVASIAGLQIGKVLKLVEDPDGEHRIQVTLPVSNANEPGIWARLSSFYASKECGSLFVPEVDDEVVLGFLDGHPSHPIVLGSLYSSKVAPWAELSEGNNIKGIVTRDQMKVLFDEEKKIISIETPNKNTLIFSDDEKSIVMSDQTGNTITCDEKGITLDSPKDIKINAQGGIEITAGTNIKVDSKADVSVSGNNVNNDAKVAFNAKGNASATVEASGQTTVKGAMVMIN